ncbi:MAG: Na/Pi cotransporter family protein, partial [Ruminococcus sp.]|nr:Na/Pi cotransporter family protein [Ruminococcus sp.]
DSAEKAVVLDERLLATPPIALGRCNEIVNEMGTLAIDGLKTSLEMLDNYDDEKATEIREIENKTDHYEDIIGSFLVKLGRYRATESDALESTKLFKMIGDFERISDHSVNIIESAEELRMKDIVFTAEAQKEFNVMVKAVKEIIDLTQKAFAENDFESAYCVEPLEQVIDDIKERLRTNHIVRLQQGNCSIEAGFVWSDLLHNLERISDHCSNIAGCVIESAHNDINLHEGLRDIRNDSTEYFDKYRSYSAPYAISNKLA